MAFDFSSVTGHVVLRHTRPPSGEVFVVLRNPKRGLGGVAAAPAAHGADRVVVLDPEPVQLDGTVLQHTCVASARLYMGPTLNPGAIYSRPRVHVKDAR